jgi:Histidinol dehydrogenase
VQIIQSLETKNFLQKLSQKNNLSNNDKISSVRKTIFDVQKNGDDELIKICNQFDKANFQNSNDFVVSEAEISQARKNVNLNLLEALKISYNRIFSYHQKQLPQDFSYTDKEGVKLGNIWKAIDSVGVYVPGGTANYPSSVLMGAVPAIVAGVENISITVPSHEGEISDAVLVAADLCGIKKIYKVGGAGAIAALAFGTQKVQQS